ncbi:hypothetical protein M0802_003883 [Mischocyttarus mexicanus]|nr:hypothetical protein M0802_003883 [Mischocyttarus mexicanus]
MPVRVAQRPPGGIPLHAGVPVAANSVTASGPSGRCLGGPAASPAGSPPLPPSLQSLGGGISGTNNNINNNNINGNNQLINSNGGNGSILGGGNPLNGLGNLNNGNGGNGLNNSINNNTTASSIAVATNPLQAMASAAASLTQLNNMANGPLPPLAGTGPPNLPAPQPATTPTHGGGPPTPHGGVGSGPHLNGASPSPHPMPPHGMMSGSPHAPHPHMPGGGPSPHPHHPASHMVGSPHHPGPHPMPPNAAGMMAPAGMQPQNAPGMCGPGPSGPMGPHGHPQAPGQPHMHNDPFYCSPFGSHYFSSVRILPGDDRCAFSKRVPRDIMAAATAATVTAAAIFMKDARYFEMCLLTSDLRERKLQKYWTKKEVKGGGGCDGGVGGDGGGGGGVKLDRGVGEIIGRCE